VIRVEHRHDFAPAPFEERLCPRTGVLTVRGAPTWVGVRAYQRADGSISRELHRLEQVTAPGWVRQLSRLPVPVGHPSDPETGAPVWLHVDPRATPPEGYVTRTPSDAIGWTGPVEPRACAEYPSVEVPTVEITLTRQVGIDLLRAGVSQTSLAYDVYVDPTPGIWVAPDGSEHAYDAEHILDPDDPRVLALPAALRATLGPNHLAWLPHGRGGAQAEVRWDAGIEGIASAVPTPTEAEIPSRIAVVTRITIPPVLRRSDAQVSIEIPSDDPALIASLEAFFAQAAVMLTEAMSAKASMEAEGSEVAEKIEKLEEELMELRPLADRGRELDRQSAADAATAMGVAPKGDSGPAIREAAVSELAPEVLSRYPAGDPRRVAAADAAFGVLCATRAKPAPAADDKPPKAGTRTLRSADAEDTNPTADKAPSYFARKAQKVSK